MKFRRFLFFSFLILLLLSPIGFFVGFGWAAQYVVERYNVPQTSHNAVKHAYTAATLYGLLRGSGISQETAEQALLSLGLLNEWAELYVKRDEDSAGEIRKDLQNNWVGMVVSEWRIAHAPGEPLSAIMAMCAKKHIVLLTPPTIQNDAQGMQKITEAQSWLEQNRQDIQMRTLTALDKR